jgi:hypothetical protein
MPLDAVVVLSRSRNEDPPIDAVVTDCPSLLTSEVPSVSTSDSVPATSSAPEVSLPRDERVALITQAGARVKAARAAVIVTAGNEQ